MNPHPALGCKDGMNTCVLYRMVGIATASQRMSLFRAHQLSLLNNPRFRFSATFRSLVNNVGRFALAGLLARRPLGGDRPPSMAEERLREFYCETPSLEDKFVLTCSPVNG